MNLLFVYNKETGTIESGSTTWIPEDYFYSLSDDVEITLPITDGNGNKIGEKTVPYIDPNFGAVKTARSFDHDEKGIFIFTDQSKSDFLSQKIIEKEYPTQEYNQVDENGQTIATLTILLEPTEKTTATYNSEKELVEYNTVEKDVLTNSEYANTPVVSYVDLDLAWDIVDQEKPKEWFNRYNDQVMKKIIAEYSFDGTTLQEKSE